MLFLCLAHPPVLSPTVRKGYRIQADKERDSMKVLYYVEKELAQFDPARRMRGRCEHLLVSCDLCFIKDSVAEDEMVGVGGPRSSDLKPRASRYARDTTTKVLLRTWKGIEGDSSESVCGCGAVCVHCCGLIILVLKCFIRTVPLIRLH